MKPSEIIASIIACILIGLVVRTLIVDHQHMDATSYVLAAIVIVSSFAFVGFTFLHNRP